MPKACREIRGAPGTRDMKGVPDTMTDHDTKVQVHIPFPMLVERLGEVVEASLNPEIFFDAATLDSLDTKALSKVGFELDTHELRATVHGPYMDMSPGGADEKVRKVTVERFTQLLRAVHPISPATVVLHAGYDARIFDGDENLWLTQSLKTWEKVVKEAEAANTVIALENIFEEEPGPIMTLISRMNSPHLRACIDVGHINAFAKAPMDEWLSVLGPYLGEVHIHDNFGEKDDHLPVGDGEIDFSLFFSLIKRYSPDQPVYTIEPHGEEVLWRGLRTVMEYL